MLFYQPVDVVKWLRNTKKYIDRNVFVSPDVNVPEKSMSICITCMNRLHDLKHTLPKNLEDNKHYSKLEFVLLDYNSTDGLSDWVKNKMMRHIESGRLVYYRTEDPKFFQPNHSRNLSFRLATGQLVANVDSDNFTHAGYAKRINQCASVADGKIIILPSNFLEPNTSRSKLKGRFALYKFDIEQMRGFDEDLDGGFGNDDLNFVFRAFVNRFKLVRFESRFTEGRLETTNADRVKYVRNKNYEEAKDNNKRIMEEKLCRGLLSVNANRPWGAATVVKNFEHELVVQ